MLFADSLGILDQLDTIQTHTLVQYLAHIPIQMLTVTAMNPD